MNEIAILLCTYNGEAYLQEQLDSLIAQHHTHWRLYVSDDGSTDTTLDVLEHYRSRLRDRMVVVQGPRQGFARNFLSLLQVPTLTADYYAFCDQDDVWHPDKLTRAMEALKGYDSVPALYCSRTRLVDEDGKYLGDSPLFKRAPCFQNALVQSLAGANTMLINKLGRALLLKVDDRAPIVAHDWLAYLVVSAAAGRVVYDPVPTLDYRQHSANLIGGNARFRDRLARLRLLMDGRFARWNEANILALEPFRDEMPDANKRCLDAFRRARSSPPQQRLRYLRQSGVYRQTISGNLSLLFGNLMGRI